jgi:uncharacterized protein
MIEDNWQNWHAQWSTKFRDFAVEQMRSADSGHDFSHVCRVVKAAESIGRSERSDPFITLPAAWLHDCVAVAKDSPLRSQASRMAADRAAQFLTEIQYAPDRIPLIHHAIVAHSFSANIAPESLDARVVQDADRLEALGALGLARCLATGGTMGTQLLNADEPFPWQRSADDAKYSVDHLFVKLLKLPQRMHTAAGRSLATKYADFLIAFLQQLAIELHVDAQSLERAIDKSLRS